MNDERLIEIITERLIQRIQDTNTYILKEIGNSIKQIRDVTPTKRLQLIQILRYGDNYQNMLKKISEMTDLNVKDIEDIFMSVAKKDYYFAEKFYKARNIKPISFKDNTRLIAQTREIARVIQRDMYNFTRENVLGYSIKDLRGNVQFVGLKETYNRAIEEAILNISQGKQTFNTIMSKTIKDIGGSGLKTLDYKSGRSIRLDSMIRMHVLDGLRVLHNANQELFGEEFEYNGIEVTHHLNAAPDHIDTVDGKQFAVIQRIQEQIDGGIEKEIKQSDIRGNQVKVKGKWYDDFDAVNNSLLRKVSTLNCRHEIFTIILGVSEPEYTQKQLDEDKKQNINGFNFEGKHYSMYDGEQLQRTIERAIRKQKDTQIMAKASGDMNLVEECQQKITLLTDKYRELCKVSGLPTKMQRMRVSGYRRTKI